LVLYKGRQACIRRAGKRLQIELGGGETLKVRPKDVVPLHPGPIESLDDLRTRTGELETAWELLAGEATTLAELAELAYGEYTPDTAWAAWQLVEDGLYFQGTPEAVVARTPEQVSQERADREARAANERARAAFLERVRAGRVLPEDGQYLRKVEDLALARRTKSRILRELGRKETAESAHALLL
jgi:exoribonuclease-2